MNLGDLLFGARPRKRRLITAPPRGVRWRSVRPRSDVPAARAWTAESEHVIDTGGARMEAHPGDMVVEHRNGDKSVVRPDIFAQTYDALGGGLYRKRDDIVLRYFTLAEPALIETLEGPQPADPGDWIMQGVNGELWPVEREQARHKYIEV